MRLVRALAALVTGTFLCLAAASLQAAPATDLPRPNVIIILTDDQGTLDLRCCGAEDLHTPNLDALAARGVRFTQFYSGAPVCSPSRASLLTGRCPQRAGVPGNAGSQPGSRGMPPEQVTIAEMLKAAGYITGHVGKWHLGYIKETMPNGQGFDSSFGHMGGCIDNYSHFFYWNGPNRHDLWRDGKEVWEDGSFFGELMVRECVRFIQENQRRPFFLYWAINMPHYPLQGLAKWRRVYEKLPAPRRMYAAFVSTLDEMVGRVLGKVDALGLRRNTLVIFMSDHGYSTEVRTFGGGGFAGPFRGAKFSLFEGGVRVPAIASLPGRLPEGAVRSQVGIAMDWLPTIAEICRVELPARKLDGASLVPVMLSAGAPSPHAVLNWQSGRGKWGPQWAVRQGDWKLIGNPNDTSHRAPITEQDRRFLVNLAEDISEMTNVAGRHPDIVKRLEKLHEQWMRTATAP